MASQTKSPFSELSFSEQQEMWRAFRAQHLEYQQVGAQEEPAAVAAPKRRAVPYEAAEHKNLSRVYDRLSSAARRAGIYQSVSARETGDEGSAPSS